MVCGFCTVAVLVPDDDAVPAPEAVAAAVARVVGAGAGASGPGTAESRGGGRLVTVPCAFDGPDLGEVAALAGCASRRGGDRAYRGAVDRRRAWASRRASPTSRDCRRRCAALPRRDRPRPAVPAGSVALAAGHAAVYPTASPGGWHLIGRTGFPFFGLAAPPYAALAPGDQVRFTVAGADDPRRARARRSPPMWSLPGDARARLRGRRTRAAGGPPGTAGVARSPRWVCPVPGRPTRCRSTWPTFVGRERARSGGSRAHGGRDQVALPSTGATWPWWAPHPRSVSTGTPAPAGQLLPLARGPGPRGRPASTAECRSYVSVAGGFLGPAVVSGVAPATN